MGFEDVLKFQCIQTSNNARLQQLIPHSFFAYYLTIDLLLSFCTLIVLKIVIELTDHISLLIFMTSNKTIVKPQQTDA
jgi:hypothetical protein